jgi:hypothetical protein
MSLEIPQFIELAQKHPALRFLVIGGYAVAAHGFSRMTNDVDFLANKEERDAWLQKLTRAGLVKTFETSAFAQFHQEAGEGFDLMFVNNETFEKFWADAKETTFSKTPARMPSLDHLLALKLHALKGKPPHRTSKDAEDVEMLVRNNNLDLTDRKYEELFLKYASRDIYETILRVLQY